MKGPGNNRGIALIFTLGALSVLLAVGLAFLSFVRLEEKAAKNYLDHIRCGAVMRAGVEHALAVLKLQRNDGYDSFQSLWRTAFEGLDYDNSGDGLFDSGWIEITGAAGIVSGRYAVLVEDEAGKLNLNRAGNLSVSAGEGFREHGQNEGWSTFEISISDMFTSLEFSSAPGLSEHIIRERYGGYPDAGGYGFNLGIPEDGIDNDADGGVASIDPFGFTSWKPSPEFFQNPFVELSQSAVVDSVLASKMDALSEHATVYSRSPNMYFDGGGWRDKVNINAFDCPLLFYSAVSGIDGISDAEACRYAVNILDYRDENNWVSEFQSPATGDIYYGVESVLINEVLCNSFMENTQIKTNNSGGTMTFTYSGLAPDTAYRVSVGLGYFNNPANVTFRVGGGAWQNGSSGGGYSVIYRRFDYIDIENSRSDSEGNITISTDYRKTKPCDESPSTGSVSIWDVSFTAAEFVELVNISAVAVELEGWEIEVASGGSSNVRDIPFASIEPGSYLILTNDLDLFGYSYGDMNAVEVAGWESGYSTGGEFPYDGEFEMYVYIDRDRSLLADLFLNGNGNDTPEIEPPGQSSGIGISREKSDPALRTSWLDNSFDRASPGADNSVTPEDGLGVLEGLRDGSQPPLVKNKPFASPGEIIEAGSWRDGGLRYPGVRGGDAPWAAVPSSFLGKIAERISAGCYLRFDAAAADISGPAMKWGARLDRNLGRGRHPLFFYGEYTGQEDDILVEGLGEFGFKKSGGVRAGALHADGIPRDGSFAFEISGDFDYAVLVPDSIQGKININTASREVLEGLPAVCGSAASAIISEREIFPFASVGGLLLRNILSPEQFAPAANLAAVNSDVFRILCTARTPHPSDPENPELFSAERSVEVLVDRSGGSLRIIAWKEAYR